MNKVEQLEIPHPNIIKRLEPDKQIKSKHNTNYGTNFT